MASCNCTPRSLLKPSCENKDFAKFKFNGVHTINVLFRCGLYEKHWMLSSFVEEHWSSSKVSIPSKISYPILTKLHKFVTNVMLKSMDTFYDPNIKILGP